MKRFISALTALCMAMSMTVATIPASAINLSDYNAVNAQADSVEWTVEDVTFDPQKAEGFQVKVVVNGTDPGILGYQLALTIDGKTVDQSTTFEVDSITPGDAYPGLGQAQSNPDYGYIGASDDTKTEDVKAASGSTVAIFDVYPKAGVTLTPGATYELGLTDVVLGNAAKQEVTPTLGKGTLTIAGGTTQPTQAQPTEAQPTQAPTEKTAPDGWYWAVKDVEVGADEAQEGFEIQVIMGAKDPGIYGYEFTLQIDGKDVSASDFEIDSVEPGAAYKFSQFQANAELGSVTSTDDQKEGDYTANDGAVIANFMVFPKAGVTLTPGAEYKLSLTDMTVGNYARDELTPAVQNGTLKIKGGTTNPTTAQPTEAQPTEQTTEKPTESGSGDKQNLTAWTWYVDDLEIGADEAQEGFELKVIMGAKDPGIYGYEFTMTVDGKPFASSDFEIDSIEPGAAYKFSQFQANAELGSVTSTDDQKEGDYTANDGAVIATFMVFPKDGVTLTPGTEYKLSLTDMTVGNYARDELTPAVLDGILKIKGGSDEDPTEATPTEAQPTEPQPTQGQDPTEKETEATPTEKTTDAPQPTEAYSEKTSDVDSVWDIAEVECNAGETVSVPVKVTGNVGFNSFIAKIKADAGPTVAGSESGASFTYLNLADNKDNMSFAGTDYSSGKDMTGDGDVFIMQFAVPANATPGTVYKLNFDALDVFNIDMVKLLPKTSGGSITIKDIFEDKSEAVAGQWVIGQKYAEPGETVELPVSVTGMTAGINSYIAKLNADSKLTATGAAAGTAYASLSFADNTTNMSFAGTNYKTNEDVAGEGEVFLVSFTVPETAQPGDTFDVKWDSLELRNYDMVKLVPELVDGWIKIKNDETEASSEEAPTEKETEKTTDENTTDPTEEQPSETDAQPSETDVQPSETDAQPSETDAQPSETDAQPTETQPTPTETQPEPTENGTQEPTEEWMSADPEKGGAWIIGTAEVDPGATVVIPVTIYGDGHGLNSYIMKMGVEAGPEILSAENGDAFPAVGFAYNKDNASFAYSGYASKTNMIAPNNAVVFNVTFKVPDNAAPGTVYDLTFEGLEIYDVDMALLDPMKVPGWIKIKDDVTPSETDAAPTEKETEKTTDEKTTDPTEEQPSETDAQPSETDAQPSETDVQPSETDAQPSETDVQPSETEPTPSETDVQPSETEPVTYKVTWDIEDGVSAKPGQKKVAVNVVINGDTEMTTFKTGIKPDANLTYNGYDPGTAYGSLLEIAENAEDKTNIQYAGKSATNGSLKGSNGVVMTFYFDIPEKKADGTNFTDGEKLPISWIAEECQVLRLDEAVVNATFEDGYIVIDSSEVVKYEYTFEYSAEGSDKFYFAHDPRPFDLASLNGVLKRQAYTADGNPVGDPVAVNLKTVKTEMAAYNVGDGKLTSPKAVYDSGAGKQDLAYCKLPLQVTITDVLPSGEPFVVTLTPDSEKPFVANAYIGVKGDTDLSGVCNATDAAKVLIYAADYGANKNPSIATNADLENFVYFLSDVDGESEDHGATTNGGAGSGALNASDAAKQLIYAAVYGASPDKTCNWATQVFGEGQTLPKYTNEIHEWEKANPNS